MSPQVEREGFYSASLHQQHQEQSICMRMKKYELEAFEEKKQGNNKRFIRMNSYRIPQKDIITMINRSQSGGGEKTKQTH